MRTRKSQNNIQKVYFFNGGAIFSRKDMAFSLWKGAMKNAILALLMVAIVMTLSGCGETVSGVGKDVNRMGKGISTFFFRQ